MIKKHTSRKVFEVANYTFMVLFCISILIPFVNCIAISLSSYDAVAAHEVSIWPKGFTFRGYTDIAGNLQFWRTFITTAWTTALNTILVIMIALMAAYGLSSKYLIGKKFCIIYFMIPYYFGGGLIPSYLLITNLGLTDNYLAYILPAIVSIYYIIVFRNVIAGLPKELLESAEIDGARQGIILFKIVIPLILPTIAAFIVFSAVGNWNQWQASMLYMRDDTKWQLQYQLRHILNVAEFANKDKEKTLIDVTSPIHAENKRMAAIMITILPIIVIYPFVQKYFIAGVLVGAVKG